MPGFFFAGRHYPCLTRPIVIPKKNIQEYKINLLLEKQTQ